MGSVGSTSTNSYLQNYLKNTPWINDSNRQMMIDNFNNNLSYAQQYFYSLPEKEQNALVGMQTNTHRVNEYQRNNDSGNEDLDNWIQNIKSAIGKYKLKEPVVTYRGVSEAEFNNLGNSTESFKSTSTKENMAELWAKNQGGYVIEYHISPGARVADVNGAPGANEDEILIDSGVRYKSVKKDGKRAIVYI